MEGADDLDPGHPKRKGGLSRGCIIGIVLAVALSCGGITTCIGGLWFVTDFGMDMVADQVAEDLEHNPVVLEHLGRIVEIDANLGASMRETGEEVFVFDVVGSKASGVLIVETVSISGDYEEVTWGRLELSSGERFDLFEGQGKKPR